MTTHASAAAEGPRAYSIDSFCTAFDIGRSSAFIEIKAGRLRACKVGRRTIILAKDADAWAAALRTRVPTHAEVE